MLSIVNRNSICYRESRFQSWRKLNCSHIILSDNRNPHIYLDFMDKPIYISDIARCDKLELSYSEPSYPRYLHSWLGIYQNQYEAGRQLWQKLLNGLREVVLIAQTQSGKTGCTKYLVHALRHCNPKIPNLDGSNIYYICGMNDNDLKKQVIQDMESLTLPQIKILDKSHILFSKQLQHLNCNHHKYKATIQPQLVIVDESHYASFKGSHVDQFINNYCNDDCKIVYVSATPFAEISYISRNPLTVGQVNLVPGPGYYGIRNLFQNDLVHQATNLNTDSGISEFLDIIDEEYSLEQYVEEYSYCIVRLPGELYYKDLEETIDEQLVLDVDYINYHSLHIEGGLSDINKLIEHPPKKMTVIWIYNTLRAGKQLDTRNLSFVHDSHSSLTEATAQALLGRLTGYGKDGHNVKCYTDLESAKRMLKLVERDFSLTALPCKSKYIKNGLKGKNHWTRNVPLSIKLNTFEQGYYDGLKREHRNRYPYKDELVQDILDVVKPDGKIYQVLTTYLPGKCGGLMILNSENRESSFNRHWRTIYQAWKNNRPIGGYGSDYQSLPGNYYYIYINLHKKYKDDEDQYGRILITYGGYVENTDQLEAKYIGLKSESRYN